MTFDDHARNMVRLMNTSQAMKDAHLKLVLSPLTLSMRSVWKTVYSEGISRNRFLPIEKLSVENKTELWEATKELCSSYQLSKDELIERAKILYTIEIYLHES